MATAIPVAYQEQVPARAAVPDIDRIDQLARGETELAMSLSRPLEQADGLLRLKLARRPGHPAVRRPAGAREHGPAGDPRAALRVRHRRAGRFWLHDFRVQPIEAVELDPDQVRSDFQDAFARVWRGEAENDGFNQLVLHGLNWRQVMVLRAYCKYLLQIGIPFSQAYMEQTLVHNPELARRRRGCSRPASIRTPTATARRAWPSSRPSSAPAWTPSPTSTRTASCGATCA